MDEPLSVRSERLILRPLQPGDTDALVAYRSLPVAARYQSWDTYTREEAEALIAEQQRVVPDTAGTWLQLGWILRETGQLIGDCGVHFVGGDQAEIGFTLSPTHGGRGLASEAVACVLDWLFGPLDKHRVFGTTDLRNEPAAKLFRRLGFREEGRLIEHAVYKSERVSEYLFAMLKREWKGKAI